jgi:hypothetical protein
MFMAILIKRFRGSILFYLLLAFFYACNLNPAREKEDPYNGVRRAYNADGTLLAQVTYKDSVRNGLSQHFYRSGKVQLEVNYVNDLKQGDEIMYYENGDLYQVTPFVDGERSGMQKKYYEGDVLMAEIPFLKNERIEGLIEYAKDGKLLTSETKIRFQLIDRTAFEDRFDLIYSLTDGPQNIKYSRYVLDDAGKILGTIDLTTIDGKASESFHLAPGRSLRQKIIVRAERKTRLGHQEIITGTYHLSVENKKRFR